LSVVNVVEPLLSVVDVVESEALLKQKEKESEKKALSLSLVCAQIKASAVKG
jgi:hypothetical protein